MKTPFLLMLFLAILLAPIPAQDTPPAAVPDHTALWDGIARQHIRPGRIGDVELNVVDYAAIARDPRWKQLLAAFETASEPTDPKDKMAFWINAYNVMAINVVLSKYPVNSIKDAGGWITAVWDIEAGIVAGKMRTLTEIEHQILRPMGDARIHAAIVCASVSCPPLRAEAFTPATLDEQLDEQMRAWLANEKIGARVDASGNLQVSSIFKWFAEDFEKDAESVRAYVERYLPEQVRTRLKPNARVSFLSYDWTLNDSKRITGA